MTQRLNFFKTRPKLAQIDLDAYMKRLHLDFGPINLQFLKALHRAHLLHIPFENLDVHYGKKIELGIQHMFKKIILGNRGGNCYELNILFLHLLNQLGYQATLGSARIFEGGTPGPELDHAIIFVELNEDLFLLDVGLIHTFHYPKNVSLGNTQLDYTQYYQFEQDPDGNYLLKRSETGISYQKVYSFELKQREQIEFFVRNNYHQESNDSWMKQEKIVSKLFPEGRITLTDRKLVKYWVGEVMEYAVGSENEFLAKLEEFFQIDAQKLVRQQLG